MAACKVLCCRGVSARMLCASSTALEQASWLAIMLHSELEQAVPALQFTRLIVHCNQQVVCSGATVARGND